MTAAALGAESAAAPRDARLAAGTAALLTVFVMLGAIKNPAELPLYARALAPLAGLGFLYAAGQLSRRMMPIYVMLGFGVFSVLASDPSILSLAKIAQIFLMTAMAHFISTQPPDRFVGCAAKLLLPIALIAVPLELALGEPEAYRAIGGLTLPRFMGLAGYHTHSAGLYFFLALLFIAHRRPAAAAFFVFATLTTGSRGFAMAGLFALLVHVIPWARVKLAVAGFLATLAVTAPIWVWQLDQALSPAQRIWLTLVTSKRYDHWLTYIRMGQENPLFGVGYLNGQTVYGDYHVGVLAFFEREQQAHNLYISTFGEWGVGAWLLLSAFLLLLVVKVAAEAPRHLPILIYVIALYSLHDGISEWVFWVGIGYVLSQANHARRGRRLRRDEAEARPDAPA